MRGLKKFFTSNLVKIKKVQPSKLLNAFQAQNSHISLKKHTKLLNF